MVLVKVVIFHGDVSETCRIADTGTDGDAGQLCRTATLVIVNVIASDDDVGHPTSRREIQRDARMVALPSSIAIFYDIICDEGAVWRRWVSSEDDARAPSVRTGIARNDLFASAQCDAIVGRRGRIADNGVVGDSNLVCRRNIADGATGSTAGSSLHVVVIDDHVTPVGDVDNVFARYRHLEDVVSDGDLGSSGGAGAAAAKRDTKALNISDDVACDDDLAHPRGVTSGSRQEEASLRVVRLIV